MTPGARISASIEILDAILAGAPGEKVLTNWARGHRYAGSGDRAAIRDHVYAALRCQRSFAWLGGAATGRGLIIGWVRASGMDISALFSGERFAPPPLSERESFSADLADAPRAVRLDCPDWLLERFDREYGVDSDAILTALQSRAPLFLRVNAVKTERAAVARKLSKDGISTKSHPLAQTALEVLENPRRVATSGAYRQGLVELQDAASQAVVEFLPLKDGQRVLDFCAGGGGKSLAMAAAAKVNITAHDVDIKRMKNLPVRAHRAGVTIDIASHADLARQHFDLVLCDVPCSGSGAWRRSPEAKWSLTQQRLADLCDIQASILNDAGTLVKIDGVLAYATCSLFDDENRAQIDGFLQRHADWRMISDRQLTPLQGGDGFYVALLTRANIES
ncbi:MAG: RsmB/NOP family class I SAM-dependent RNA methyltransferase [Paracoccaceae bacterium]